MKKACIIFVLSLISSHLFAQDIEVGIQITPNVSFSRITEKSNTDTFEQNARLKLAVGPIVDIELTPNIYLSTGAFFTTKGVKYTSSITEKDESKNITEPYVSTVNVDLQYIQLPIGLKLFTGEIASSTKLFFQLGGLIDVKISEKYKDDNFLVGTNSAAATGVDIDQKFAKFMDVAINLTIGTEIEVGSNKAYAGISYNRGLINVLHKDFADFTNKDDVKINADLIGLVLGFKF